MSEARRTAPPATSALSGVARSGRHGANAGAEPGVRLAEVCPAAVLQVHGAGAATAPVAGTVPPAPGRASRGATADFLWNGPGDWLAVSASQGPADLRAGLEADLGADATVTDLGHARTVVRVAGPAARDLLAKGCPLDVDRMQADDSAATLLGPFAVHIDCRGDAGFDVYGPRSFGLALWEWLCDEAEEFGLEARPAGPG